MSEQNKYYYLLFIIIYSKIIGSGGSSNSIKAVLFVAPMNILIYKEVIV